MQSGAAIGHVVGLAFMHQQQNPARPLILVAVSIGNLFSLEKQHGRAALNHALFVCASRLRRCVPGEIEMVRLFDDAFLLVARDAGDPQRLLELSRLLAQRLSEPVVLSTTRWQAIWKRPDPWAPEVGVGLLVANSQSDPSVAVSRVNDMSRKARSYISRVACYDEAWAGSGSCP